MNKEMQEMSGPICFHGSGEEKKKRGERIASEKEGTSAQQDEGGSEEKVFGDVPLVKKKKKKGGKKENAFALDLAGKKNGPIRMIQRGKKEILTRLKKKGKGGGNIKKHFERKWFAWGCEKTEKSEGNIGRLYERRGGKKGGGKPDSIGSGKEGDPPGQQYKAKKRWGGEEKLSDVSRPLWKGGEKRKEGEELVWSIPEHIGEKIAAAAFRAQGKTEEDRRRRLIRREEGKKTNHLCRKRKGASNIEKESRSRIFGDTLGKGNGRKGEGEGSTSESSKRKDRLESVTYCSNLKKRERLWANQEKNIPAE